MPLRTNFERGKLVNPYESLQKGMAGMADIMAMQQKYRDDDTKAKLAADQLALDNKRADARLGIAQDMAEREIAATNRAIGKDRTAQVSREQTNMAMINPSAARTKFADLVKANDSYNTRLDSFDLDTPEGERAFLAEPSRDVTRDLNKASKIDWSKVRSGEKAQLDLDLATPGTDAYKRAAKAAADQQLQLYQDKIALINYKDSLKEPRAKQYDLFADPQGNLHNIVKGEPIPAGYTKATGSAAGRSKSNKTADANSKAYTELYKRVGDYSVNVLGLELSDDHDVSVDTLKKLEAAQVDPTIVTRIIDTIDATGGDRELGTDALNEAMPSIYNPITGKSEKFGDSINNLEKNGLTLTVDEGGRPILVPTKVSPVKGSVGNKSKVGGTTSATDNAPTVKNIKKTTSDNVTKSDRFSTPTASVYNTDVTATSEPVLDMGRLYAGVDTIDDPTYYLSPQDAAQVNALRAKTGQNIVNDTGHLNYFDVGGNLVAPTPESLEDRSLDWLPAKGAKSLAYRRQVGQALDSKSIAAARRRLAAENAEKALNKDMEYKRLLDKELQTPTFKRNGIDVEDVSAKGRKPRPVTSNNSLDTPTPDAVNISAYPIKSARDAVGALQNIKSKGPANATEKGIFKELGLDKLSVKEARAEAKRILGSYSKFI